MNGVEVSSLRLSVVIPIGPQDLAWQGLVPDLKHLPTDSEVILVATEDAPTNFVSVWQHQLVCRLRWVKAKTGRAVQQNAGAYAADGQYLLFLHADSKFPRATMNTVFETIKSEPLDSVFHFDLQFLNDGPKLVQLNSMMANWRARVLKMPFGDQGFLLSKKVFERLGGFAEDAAYGEDHILVWEARRRKIPVRRLSGVVFTSARKYQKNGWGAVTRRHIWLTTKQAVSEGFKLLKVRLTDF